MTKIEDKFIDIKKSMLVELRTQMNGAVVGTMEKLIGGEPYFSYGVAIPRVKEQAQLHKGNHELALSLFNSEIRELKLAGIYVDDCEKVTSDQMEKWSKSFHSLEIAENASTMLFFGAPCALEVALQWIDTPELRRMALMIVGKRLRSKYSENDNALYEAFYQKAKVLATLELERGEANALAIYLASQHRHFPKEVEALLSDKTTSSYIVATTII
ncbi:MAG: hypothetical protein IMY73_03770 [Bacteroidetes bacterium]|nr:hypothetical protein [Bacteroidota bacterium]